jgi:hypothetical protein
MPNEEPHNRASLKSARPYPEETNKKAANASFGAQGEFFNAFEEMSRDWISRATTEVELGLKLSKKLSAAHSVPDAIAAYQEWLSEEMSVRAEDARRLISTGQKFMNTGSRLMSNGWTNFSA